MGEKEKAEISCYSWVILAGKIISRFLSETFIFFITNV